MSDFITRIIDTIFQSPLLNGWDSSAGTIIAAAVILAALWAFFRVLRLVAGALFLLCAVLLVLKFCFDIDAARWLEPLLQQITSLF